MADYIHEELGVLSRFFGGLRESNVVSIRITYSADFAKILLLILR